MKKGDVVISDNSRTGILLDFIQVAWGAKKYRILWDTGDVDYVWDKHIRVISEGDDREK